MVVNERIKVESKQILKEIDAGTLDLKSLSLEIKKLVKKNGSININHCEHIDGIVSGLKSGNILITGSTGDYAGALNAGASISVQGDVGNYLGDNMTNGDIVVYGNAGYCTAPYCYGGQVIITGNSGDFTGTMNKGATIIIEENVGDEVATYMLKGDIIILGDAGKNLGNYIISGRIFIQGKWKSLGNNTKIEDMTSEDIEFLKLLFKTYNIEANPEKFIKIVPETDSPFYSKKN